ncbi:hypothetical protein PVAP13_3KG507703 [Panicum virgatum]|uniref:Uncharacterized protein n=1 Tax=Panicum virgatum TaxID=38727 RepID=A0A8T0VDH6_PANVG|nr:hypothetical protein PVAP13_3KG507703 [Panicum virgatum]KAG2629859.1 hypothetical protein PVAP13_3KG507703 [Panicum virgatum]
MATQPPGRAVVASPEAKKLKNNGLMLLLFETPSGSLVLHFSLILRFTFTYLLL